ncbi:MAG TPA: DJ-1/PfpI family protein [Polyangiaceae bacterium]|nr:DJ-1/PfpI family protein [Polyangiaceae bacterium]
MRTRPYRLAVVCFDEMDLLDVAGPLEVFSTAGRKWNWRAIKAELVSSVAAPRATRAQLQVGPVSDLASCPEPELLLIPGGYGARRAQDDARLIEYLAAARPGLTLTLSVGLGSLLAARAGLLSGATVAAPPSLAEELVALDASIVVETTARTSTSPGRLTAAQNGNALELGLEAVALLLGKSQALGTARELGYAWGTETLAVELLIPR